MKANTILKISLTLIALCLWLHGTIAQQVLAPEADTYAHSNAHSTNYGNDIELYSVMNASNTLYIYIRFDLSQLTSADNAILRLYVTGNPSTDYRIIRTVEDNSWDENTMTWDNKPAVGDSINYLIPDQTGQWLEIDVSTYVKTSLANGKVTFAITTSPSTEWSKFASKENSTNKPELILNSPQQGPVFLETFGTGGYYDGQASSYALFSSGATFSDDLINIHNHSPQSNYEGASAENFIKLGRVKQDPITDRLQFVVSNINTLNYENVRLSLGHAVYASSAKYFLSVYYSTNGTEWTKMNNELVHSGQWAEATVWGYVTLEEILPSTSNLYLKFENLNTAQTVRLDDIMLNGLPDDNTPPSKPQNLVSHNLSPYGCVLAWDESSDNYSVSHYELYRNAIPVGSYVKPYALIERQTPESTIEFTVVAVDVKGNRSEVSDILAVTFPAETNPEGQAFLWNDNQAQVLPNGELRWSPKPFEYQPGSSVRYIDFEAGDDSNTGTSTAAPWKHHPWDPAATGNAASCTGIHTYVFKRGVVYRGTLVAKESGTPIEPVQLTSSPDWGTGQAGFYGSQRIESGWTQCDAVSAPNIPSPEKVWYIDLSSALPATKVVCEVSGETMNRLSLARVPNWQITDSVVPMSNWWRWTGVEGNQTQTGKLIDTKNLTQTDPEYWKGGTVWSEWKGTMGTVWAQTITSYDPATHSIVTPNIYGGEESRYFIENLPQLLDTANEYWFDKSGTFPGRLYVRLSGDRNPNSGVFEVATNDRLITINDQQYITISGLAFGFTTSDKVVFNNNDAPNIRAIININAGSRHITVANCSFDFVSAAIASTASHVTISDNAMRYIDHQAITCGPANGAYTQENHILRNMIYNSGGRQLCRWYSAIPAIAVYTQSGTIAGNFIDYTWGAGIYGLWGKSSGDGTREIPLIRGYVFNNRVRHSLLGTSDWGGIEHWQGGPVYYYNNYSENAPGWKGSMSNVDYNPWGFPYYFDGSYKLYAFNNIAVSPNNSTSDPSKRNRSAYQMVLGMNTMVVNNSAYKFYKGITIQQNDGGTPCYNYLLGNLLEHITNSYFMHKDLAQHHVPFESISNNVLYGPSGLVSENTWGSSTSVEHYSKLLEQYGAQAGTVGWKSVNANMTDPDNKDFRITAESEAIDRGVKFFAPLSLYATVGEWHFYRHANDSSLIMGDNLYMTTEYVHRGDYQKLEKNHLKAHGITANSYKQGNLEDWIPGALEFNGTTTYCSVPDNSPSQLLKTNDLDMQTNNFILEVYLKTTASQGTVVSKHSAASNGYSLSLEAGAAKMALISGGTATFTRTGSTAINDGNWHHILAEVNRTGTINIYIDGSLENGATSGTMPSTGLSLTNTADFLVGKNHAGNFFGGTIDFLRVSKGSLEDALTTINELYSWEFDGPFLYDFAGNTPQGPRDAGALETGSKACILGLSASSFDYTKEGGSNQLTITAANGFEVGSASQTFVSTSLSGNVLTVTVEPNVTTSARSATVMISGCNESIPLKISQEATPNTIHTESGLPLRIYPNPVKNKLYIESEGVIRQVSVYTLQGQCLVRFTPETLKAEMPVQHLATGMYILEIQSESDFIQTRFIKE